MDDKGILKDMEGFGEGSVDCKNLRIYYHFHDLYADCGFIELTFFDNTVISIVDEKMFINFFKLVDELKVELKKKGVKI